MYIVHVHNMHVNFMTFAFHKNFIIFMMKKLFLRLFFMCLNKKKNHYTKNFVLESKLHTLAKNLLEAFVFFFYLYIYLIFALNG